MCIGSAARLLLLRDQTTVDNIRALEADDSTRCFWSIFVLERTFSTGATQISDTKLAPRAPHSACLPPATATHIDGTHSPESSDDNDTVPDLGINHYSLALIKIWGSLQTHLQELRNGKMEEPWTAESTYSRLNVALYENDAQLCTNHLLRNVKFGSRSRQELGDHQHYWQPWLVMQILSHAMPALLNHPFVHLTTPREGISSIARSRFFLQQTVDTALLHSAWVARLLQMCDELEFVIWNPLIGDVVASTATVAWVFQFTGDAKTHKQAVETFQRCQSMLARLATSWPHLSRKVPQYRTTQLEYSPLSDI